MIMRSPASSYLLAAAANVCIACAWLVPGSAACALLGWIGALLYVAFLKRSARCYLPAFCGGVLLNLIGFYWLNHTIVIFGGFPQIVGWLLLLLFALVSALQFVVLVFLYQRLPHMGSLRIATAWVLAEFITPRIFPWYLGHTQLAFSALAQAAELGGVLLISLLMLWTAETVYDAFAERRSGPALAGALAVLAAACMFGALRMPFFREEAAQAPALKVAVLQANIDVIKKNDISYFSINTARYLEKSREAAAADTLVIWPESAMMSKIPTFINSAAQNGDLRRLPQGAPYLLGTIMVDSLEHIFNSVLAVRPDGSLAEPYHKRILMPFGEFTPATSDTFPSNLVPAGLRRWLRQVNATAGEFSAGDKAAVFEYPASIVQGAVSTLKVSPLVCYEDVIGSPARESVLKGAELLVNLTNDAWFGNSAAPHQHHLIASFRAIENRRYLVRSTNTGLTAVVNPLGQTVSQLAPFSDGTLLAKVHLIGYKTIYTRFIGEWIWWALTAAALLTLAVSTVKRKRVAQAR